MIPDTTTPVSANSTPPVLLRDRFLFETTLLKPVPTRINTDSSAGTRLIDVAIPLPVKDPYTYRISEELAKNLQCGCRVRIPFQNRTIVGYVVGINLEKTVKKTKEILDVIDVHPVVSDHLLRLAKLISEYYFSSWGEAISNMVPKYLKQSESQPESEIEKRKDFD